MKRAGDVLTDDLASMPDVGTKMRAVGFHDVGLTAFCPIQNHVLIEKVEGFDIAGFDVVTVGDGVPAVRYG